MNLVQYQSEAVEKLVQGFKELIVAAKPNAAMILHASDRLRKDGDDGCNA